MSISKRSGFTLIETVIFVLVLAVAAGGVMALYSNIVRRGSDPLVRQKGIILAQELMDEILSRRWDERTPNGGGCLDACDGAAKDGRNDSGSCGIPCDCDPACNDDDASAIGLDAGEGAVGPRQEWDDVDDYDGLLEDNGNAAAGDDLADQQGTLLAGAANFSRQVEVMYAVISGGSGTAGDPYTFAVAGNGRGSQDPDNSCGGSSPRTNFKQITVIVTTPNNEPITLVSIKGNY
ncbi:MAG: hypothetical protein JXO49_08835 [Deltaproteobacteria bacterium]|nr:hypothetical protein [Candidatus Anaeroferrophillus wilburensis]MBN2889434.1 hypothetical protein [Deltaproteobacteria bacterium]